MAGSRHYVEGLSAPERDIVALEAKFMACATRAVDADAAAEWLRALWAIERQPRGQLFADE